MSEHNRLELRAKDPVAQCLIRRLTVPRVYFDANWPLFEHVPADLLLIDRDGVGDAHLVEIKRTAESALAQVRTLLKATAPFRWVAFLRGTADKKTIRRLASHEDLYLEGTAGRVGVIEFFEMTNGELGANILVSAERFPDAVYDVAMKFSSSHKANIQFGD